MFYKIFGCAFLSVFSLLTSPLLADERERTDIPAIITAVTTQPVNGGINPFFRGFRLQATVFQGENSCLADNVVVRLQVRQVEDAIEVEAFKTVVSNTICNKMYRPVYRNYTTELHFDGQMVHRIIIKNFQQRNADHVIITGA